MKIVIRDFDYNGKHYDTLELDMPGVKSVDQIPEGRLEWYIKECLEGETT